MPIIIKSVAIQLLSWPVMLYLGFERKSEKKKIKSIDLFKTFLQNLKLACTSAKYQVQKLQRKTIPKEIFQIFKVILIKVLDVYCMY